MKKRKNKRVWPDFDFCEDFVAIVREECGAIRESIFTICDCENILR